MQIKLASVTLARLYVKRVASQLNQTLPIKETVREFLLLQGVRFAFRVHQVIFCPKLMVIVSNSELKSKYPIRRREGASVQRCDLCATSLLI